MNNPATSRISHKPKWNLLLCPAGVKEESLLTRERTESRINNSPTTLRGNDMLTSARIMRGS